MLTNDIKIPKELIKKLADSFKKSKRKTKKMVNRTLGDSTVNNKLNNGDE